MLMQPHTRAKYGTHRVHVTSRKDKILVRPRSRSLFRRNQVRLRVQRIQQFLLFRERLRLRLERFRVRLQRNLHLVADSQPVAPRLITIIAIRNRHPRATIRRNLIIRDHQTALHPERSLFRSLMQQGKSNINRHPTEQDHIASTF